LPEIITLRWQGCAAAIEGQSEGALLPMYAGKCSGTTCACTSMPQPQRDESLP